MSTTVPPLLRKYGVPGPRYTSYPTVPFWENAPGEAQWLEHVDAGLRAGRGGGSAALYVHIPFCHALCTFCGCNMRVMRNHALAGPYVESVLREWATLRARLGRERLRLGELYLGGGTPTYLHAEELDALLGGLLAHADVAASAEFAIEADPRATHAAQLEVLRRHGFTHLSLGVQDFDPRVQEIVNRVQGEDEVRKVTEEARALGFRSVNFDLIYGLPLQTLESIQTTMDAVLALRPERITLYPYTHVPWIRSSQRRFTEADLPEGDAKRALYALGCERLRAAGYVEIGMENFALPQDALARAAGDGSLHRNFMGYTAARTDVLLGLGVSSIAAAGDVFVQNEKNLQHWQERVARGELPLQRGHVLDAEDRVLRGHVLRLLTRYATDWRDPADYTPWLDGVAERLEPLRQDGLVLLGDRSVGVTAAGRGFLRNVCMAFDARMQRRLAAAPIPISAAR